MLECLFCLAISPYFSTYDTTIKTDYGIHLSVGEPLYLWGSWEKPSLQRVGQNMGSLSLPGFGMGFKKDILFLELGYYWPSVNPDENIRNEVVDQLLENDHGKPGVTWEKFAYDIKARWGGRVGVSVDVTERFSVFGAYRFLKGNEGYDACIGPGEGCEFGRERSHWQNRDTISLSSVQVGATFRF